MEHREWPPLVMVACFFLVRFLSCFKVCVKLYSDAGKFNLFGCWRIT